MNNTFKLAGITSFVALVGCGGGGGTVVSSPAPTPPVSAVANLVTSVPSASYTGESAAAFNLLNAERSRCGFGLLAQNGALDAAAVAHANYTFGTGDTAHTETTGQPGFTGATAPVRATAKGYSANANSVGEVMSVGPGLMAIRALLNAPYHLNALVRGYRDIGIGIQNTDPQLARFVADLGYPLSVGEQLLGGSDVNTYPCEGSAGVDRQMRGETPNPVPGRDLVTSPIGTSISVKVRPGNVLAITNAGMANVATGAIIPMRAPITAANDPNKVNGASYFNAYEGYVVPDVPLDANTKYQVTIAGTNNGVPFSRTFAFTTGNGG